MAQRSRKQNPDSQHKTPPTLTQPSQTSLETRPELAKEKHEEPASSL
jgi:hypothetical protein